MQQMVSHLKLKSGQLDRGQICCRIQKYFPHQSEDGDARPGPDEDDVPAEEVADLPRLLTHAGVLGAGERALAVRQDPEHDVEHPERERDDGRISVEQREENTD